jgi:hypothetical protein
MEKKLDEARDLVREIIKEGLVDENLGRTIIRGREEIQITKPDEKSVRFDLARMKRSYVLISGRLYEKDFVLNLSDPESPVREDESPIKEQSGYKGEPEEVDTRLFKNRIECQCGNIRWVKNADLFQVKKCKPCTYRDRLNRRKLRGVRV